MANKIDPISHFLLDRISPRSYKQRTVEAAVKIFDLIRWVLLLILEYGTSHLMVALSLKCHHVCLVECGINKHLNCSSKTKLELTKNMATLSLLVAKDPRVNLSKARNLASKWNKRWYVQLRDIRCANFFSKHSLSCSIIGVISLLGGGWPR